MYGIGNARGATARLLD